MKRFAFIIVGTITLVGGTLLIPQTETFIKEKVIVEEKVVEVNSLEVRIAEAQEQALASTTAKAQEAYNEVYESEMTRIADEVKEDYIAEIEETISNPDYWTLGRVRRLVQKKAQEYGVSEHTMHAIISCESGYVANIQSRHTYTTTNAPRGYLPGEREESHGLVQIHLPAHPGVSKEEANDPYFAVEFLAKNLRDGRASMWSCYNKYLALR